jgi:hypothetical protein
MTYSSPINPALYLSQHTAFRGSNKVIKSGFHVEEYDAFNQLMRKDVQ